MATAKNGKRTDGENIGAVVTEVSERMSVLVREEIELAKAEMSQKAMSITKGAVAVGAGAMFAVFVLVYALTALAWGINAVVIDGAGDIWIGFLIVSGLVLLVAIAAFVFAWRKLRVGAPTPEMAIDEAKKIRETVTVKGGEDT
ncbi:MAG: phage holin family protein [Solirubrobacteraceae bacterium]